MSGLWLVFSINVELAYKACSATLGHDGRQSGLEEGQVITVECVGTDRDVLVPVQ